MVFNDRDPQTIITFPAFLASLTKIIMYKKSTSALSFQYTIKKKVTHQQRHWAAARIYPGPGEMPKVRSRPQWPRDWRWSEDDARGISRWGPRATRPDLGPDPSGLCATRWSVPARAKSAARAHTARTPPRQPWLCSLPTLPAPIHACRQWRLL